MINSYDLAFFGKEISDKIKGFNIGQNSILTLNLDANTFKKIDEDLYYRQFPDGKDYIPSEDEININFGFVKIKLVKT